MDGCVDGWVTRFNVILTVFQSYQVDRQVMIKRLPVMESRLYLTIS